eukprot:CAMPEP_0179421154 /NCGR_PEP_ID=MMETSP0799-20121207/9597_1 /TAXON_ID=46947 /ORGANISM="Geminigera cryophila, Strain CCMP2564" /LENGTH=505 /DNA_ID=CAMNT_0021194907 /DNA_START=65 /DNA_END=1579 /DNA_ORIENTATION=+
MALSTGLLLAIVVAASEAFSPAFRISTSRLLNGASVSRAGPAYRLLGWPLATHQPQGRGTWAVQMVEKAGAGSRGGARRGGGGGRAGGKRGGKGDSRPLKGVWRVFNVEVPASVDEGKDGVGVTRQLVSAVGGRLGVEGGEIESGSVRVVRKSFDARRVRRTGLQEPHFNYVVDIDLGKGGKVIKLKAELGKFERASGDESFRLDSTLPPPPPLPVAIIGSGPAGLFAALHLAEAGVPCVVYERGQAVEERGRDIGAMLHRRLLHPESNVCYGEGGAGTWSDGKLTTRIGRNSGEVRRVLQELVRFGAPEDILVLGKPHLGTDRLVRILKGLREYLEAKGVVFHFGTRVEDLSLHPETHAVQSLTVRRCVHRAIKETFALGQAERAKAGAEAEVGEVEVVDVSHVVMAAGHSARELFECLASKPATAAALRMAPFAVGFRIEHPQGLINSLQLGQEWSALVQAGKGAIPVADYRLATEIPHPKPQNAALHALLGDGWKDSEGVEG